MYKKESVELIEVNGIWISKSDAPEEARIKHQAQQKEEKERRRQKLKARKVQRIKTQEHLNRQQPHTQNVQLQNALHEFLDGFQQGAKILATVIKFTR